MSAIAARKGSAVAMPVLAGVAVVGLGYGLLSVGIYHLFANGSCSTTGYSRHYGPVQHCASGIGWWLLTGAVGAALAFAGSVLTKGLGGLGLLFVAIGAPFVALGLNGSSAHLLQGSSSSSGHIFSGIFGGAFVVAGIVWSVRSSSSSLRTVAPGSLLGGLLAAVVGAGGALAIGTAVAGAVGSNSPAAALPALPAGLDTRSTGVKNASSGAQADAAVADASLPSPIGANVIGATAANSLFGQSNDNLFNVIRDLIGRFGGGAVVTEMAIYPGELDVRVESGGKALPVRIESGGAISEGAASTAGQQVPSIYLGQVNSVAPTLLVNDLKAFYGVPEAKIDRMVLTTSLPGGNAGWEIYTTGRGTPIAHALLNGKGLQAAIPSIAAKKIATATNQVQQTLNQTQRQLAGTPAAAAANRQLSAAQKLVSCVQAAGTDIGKITACENKYGG